MKLKTGDRVMHEGEMYTIHTVLSFGYYLIDANGELHNDSPFTKAQAREWPVV